MNRIRLLFIGILLIATSCSKQHSTLSERLDFSLPENWAFFPEDMVKPVDVFFVAPTVFLGDSIDWNMTLTDGDCRERFMGAINMEKAIYDSDANFYAPFYRQVSLSAYETRGYSDSTSDKDLQMAFDKAYHDVEEAFDYYLSVSDKPFVLAGFSQGGEMLLKLIKNRLPDKCLQDRHIASYLIGWRITESDTEQYPHLKMAQTEVDLGVIIAFNSEADFVDNSLFVPKNTKSWCVNPLSWTTDTTFASQDFNLGACFTNYGGEILAEINHFCGAYICPERGTLKVTGIKPEDYFVDLAITPTGVYHLYDYQFFFRNIQENVAKRVDEYLNK